MKNFPIGERHGASTPLLITVQVAAPMLALTPRALYRLAAMPGALPDGLVVRLGRSVRISRLRLEAWVGASAARVPEEPR